MLTKILKWIIAAILVYEAVCYIDVLANNLNGGDLFFWNMWNICKQGVDIEQQMCYDKENYIRKVKNEKSISQNY